ncbi:MAG: bifunctional 4-hydroxy-3-methylbut-2-enyl diphosphate reductase/30S ribosomal protein S1 [Bacillota bacterium]
MQVFLAEHAGYCFGVKRSLGIVEAAGKNYGLLYSLGPLINNPQEVARLSTYLTVIDDLQDLAAGRHSDYLVIPSHGLPRQVIKKARDLGLKTIDATCPLVKKAQLLAADFVKDGYHLVIFGDKNHPEVKGVMGWAAEGQITVLEDVAQAGLFLDQLAAENELDQRVALIAQTTQIKADFAEIAQLLTERLAYVKVVNTICLATNQRQTAALDLAKKMEVMVVAGGKQSSNTKKLAQLCRGLGIPAYLVETADELRSADFQGKQKVGITAGASTPDWIIEEVVCRMLLFDEDQEVMPEESQEEAPETHNESVDQHQEDVQANDLSSQTQETEEKEVSAEDAYQLDDIQEIKRGARIQGVIVQVKQDEMLVDIGGKSEGILPASELTKEESEEILEKFNVGDEINVLVLKRENKEGYPVLSKKRIDQELLWDKMLAAKNDDEIMTGKVVEVVKGGLLVDLGGLRGFVPASLVSLGYVEDLKEYIGQELTMKILECERSANKLLLSAKAVLLEKAREKKAETLAALEEGQVVRGIVRRLTNFGAFVDIGGVDGLLHVSEMAWYRVDRPADILSQGDEIDVYVLAVDKEKEKISLSLKQIIPNPWTTVTEKYPEGTIVSAKVMRLVPFGAFFQVEPGVEGLVHISQFAHERVEKPEDMLAIDDIVDVKVLSITPENKRISLSIKATLPKPEIVEEKVEKKVEKAVEKPVKKAAAETAAPKVKEPVGETYATDNDAVTIGDVLRAAGQDPTLESFTENANADDDE